MAFTWTEEMGSVAASKEYEQRTRDAVIAACTFLDGITDGQEQPRFNGSEFVIPKNQSARDMAVAVMKGIETNTGVERETILRIAVRAAGLFRDAGGGNKGWADMGKELVSQRKQSGHSR